MHNILLGTLEDNMKVLRIILKHKCISSMKTFTLTDSKVESKILILDKPLLANSGIMELLKIGCSDMRYGQKNITNCNSKVEAQCYNIL